MILFCTLALMNGCATVISKMINFRATEELGTFNGSMVNYIIGTLVATVMMFLTKGNGAFFQGLPSAPAWSYLGGAFGIIAFILTMVTLPKMKVIHSTTLLLVGQLAAGIVFDIIIFQNISWKKLIGVTMIAIGIIWDKRTSLS